VTDYNNCVYCNGNSYYYNACNECFHELIIKIRHLMSWSTKQVTLNLGEAFVDEVLSNYKVEELTKEIIEREWALKELSG